MENRRLKVVTDGSVGDLPMTLRSFGSGSRRAASTKSWTAAPGTPKRYGSSAADERAREAKRRLGLGKPPL